MFVKYVHVLVLAIDSRPQLEQDLDRVGLLLLVGEPHCFSFTFACPVVASALRSRPLFLVSAFVVPSRNQFTFRVQFPSS